MCLGIPGQVVEVVDAAGHLAKVDVSGVRRVISTRLLAAQPPDVGDWVLVHVGFAMALIDEAEAKATLDQVQRMGQEYVDEIAAFASSDFGAASGALPEGSVR
ncbi:HypC/HybG/HupF family hydrogenase formation chaperone [Sporichthya brevicatena]|uniref:HypC/HybG/HupF family hydrogenase formation chaperone n=1 Tax=Sporichthya brevicatena TaxID=171442 RepID=UPI0031E41872